MYKAYYSRASVFVSQQKYVEALPDLDKTIELDPTTPNALTLRGQIRAQTGNKMVLVKILIQPNKTVTNKPTNICNNFVETNNKLAKD
ncbi:MAG: tetratricopeptide repeat protein [Bacteroidetes bacterium]|nr:tetratricopeptide repeat protein [Bacteroidota bacterium]